MRSGARLQAAIEILDEILAKGRPAALALADWGRSHRFAGSGDRASIGNLVYDGLRRRQSLAWRMGEDTPRALALAALRWEWGESADTLAALCSGGERHPSPLSETEAEALQAGRRLADAPAFVQGDYPEWLHPAFAQVFGNDAAAAGAALADRAPIDLRVNTLKATRDKLLRAFAEENAAPTPFSPVGVRIPPRSRDGRAPKVEASTAHGKGWFEVQDEGSQLAALLAGAAPRMQVADVCAGGGGKTLAFAALMQNTGQIFAYDADATRFRPLFERLKRAGARNVQTLEPGKPQALSALHGRMDLVLIDAPCSGTGVWRRKPDSKWRLTPEQIEARIGTQRDILAMAAPLVKPGGRLVYVTCSMLYAENGAQVSAFLAAHPEFAEEAVDMSAIPSTVSFPPSASLLGPGIQLSPHIHATDGFYIAFMQRKAGSFGK